MRQLVSLLVILLSLLYHCSNVQSNGDKKNFLLNLKYVDVEHSKDSNSASTMVKIKGRDVYYKINYGGFHAGKPIENRFQMTDSELIKLLALICVKQLMKSIQEKESTNYLGNEIRLTLIITFDKKNVTSKISGMSFIFRNNKGNITNKKYVKSVGLLLSTIKDMMYKRGMKTH